MELGTKEKILLPLCDDTKKSECAQEVADITGLSEEEITLFIEKALQEGYLETVELPDEGKVVEWLYYTKKVSRQELDDDALVIGSSLFDEKIITTAEKNIKEKLNKK